MAMEKKQQKFMNKNVVLHKMIILSFINLHCCCAIITSALNREGLLLQQVKRSLSDPAGSLSSWSDRDATPCNWTGISCSRKGSFPSVIGVNLSSASLSGPFPVAFCHLPYLSLLSLPNNSINSSLPLTISRCRRLTFLDLSSNFLEGPIPSTLADLPNLRHLDLDANSFSGEIPASFGRFQRLENLILFSNLLNGTIPASLGNITSLRVLQLAYNPFSPGRLPPELGNLTNLVDFWLTDCNLFGPIPDSFAKLIRLINFDVANNRLSGSIPSFMSQFITIEQIELFNNSFTGNLPPGWANLTELQRFDASMNGLTGPIPEELCELPLESLHLYDNRFQGKLPEGIAKSPNLYELRIFNNSLSGSLPSQLGLNSALQRLDVSGNRFSGPIPENLCEKGQLFALLMISNSFTGSIPASLGKCRSLQRVRLKGNRLTGDVPAEFWGLPNVYLLELAGNGLSGNISSLIQVARNLSSLLISGNNFSGPLPEEIGRLENLTVLSASHNQFSGKIPSSLFQLERLTRIDLENNELSGEIPRGSWKLDQLYEINLAQNKLSGAIPDEFGFLPALNYLDLSSNKFSGDIPSALQNLKLNRLNLSSNQLSGAIPTLLDKDIYRDSFLDNEGLCGRFAGSCHGESSGGKNIFLVLRSLCFIIAIWLMLVLVFVVCKLKNMEETETGVMTKWTSFHKLGFGESEIINCINEDSVIGSGSSGRVYKAVLRNGQAVAVKKLRERSNKEFETEVQTLGKIRHKNIVRLWSSCTVGNCNLLVYEYMPNGSLSDVLHDCKGKLLDWPTRFRIALDAAEGLSYLHHDCVPPIVHRDVKSKNILLDEEFGAKISDFGVAKIIRTANRDRMSVVTGSYGYIAPEYAYTLRVTEKSDIYSFGIVLLELVTGRPPVDAEMKETDLATWVRTKLSQKGIDDIIDPSIPSVFKEQVYRILDISLLCTNLVPLNRPSMRKVVKMLQESSPEFNTKIAEKDILQPS
ncbi:OLC1v1023869C1 [Oldenlandia corymbosa var. corymbosa]|uniref:non-specific serine/threonine protein kinase n=1 Tax=Oldenlandia corymbosa var. corymbosa TaxID=529605 RepID=A0AAV1C4H9_OLDCO|nr:OLC1v1023869C1 [Oldenlandia corymbosa var. corymbosa]